MTKATASATSSDLHLSDTLTPFPRQIKRTEALNDERIERVERLLTGRVRMEHLVVGIFAIGPTVNIKKQLGIGALAAQFLQGLLKYEAIFCKQPRKILMSQIN